jgi:hypothetical protein
MNFEPGRVGGRYRDTGASIPTTPETGNLSAFSTEFGESADAF